MSETVLITGGAQRTGRVIALGLAQAGYDIAIHYHSSDTEAQQTKQDIEFLGRKVTLVSGDLGDYDVVENMLDGIPNMHHIVNCASLFREDRLDDFTAENLNDHMAVNLRAPMQLARALNRLLKHDRRGSIVNILDFKVLSMEPDFLTYSMSKYALTGATEALAMQLAPKIRVNAVAPGLILPSHTQSDENYDVASRLNLNQSPNSAEDVAKTVELLVTSASLNGAIIPVDGGQRLMGMEQDITRVAADILGDDS